MFANGNHTMMGSKEDPKRKKTPKTARKLPPQYSARWWYTVSSFSSAAARRSYTRDSERCTCREPNPRCALVRGARVEASQHGEAACSCPCEQCLLPRRALLTRSGSMALLPVELLLDLRTRLCRKELTDDHEICAPILEGIVEAVGLILVPRVAL
ncbi:hypothetical protein L1887_63303 [Cichorium endivia]|nr:hypothetical protein L1887_63303 [Cichorium endivia]